MEEVKLFLDVRRSAPADCDIMAFAECCFMLARLKRFYDMFVNNISKSSAVRTGSVRFSGQKQWWKQLYDFGTEHSACQAFKGTTERKKKQRTAGADGVSSMEIKEFEVCIMGFLYFRIFFSFIKGVMIVRVIVG